MRRERTRAGRRGARAPGGEPLTAVSAPPHPPPQLDPVVKAEREAGRVRLAAYERRRERERRGAEARRGEAGRKGCEPSADLSSASRAGRCGWWRREPPGVGSRREKGQSCGTRPACPRPGEGLGAASQVEASEFTIDRLRLPRFSQTRLLVLRIPQRRVKLDLQTGFPVSARISGAEGNLAEGCLVKGVAGTAGQGLHFSQLEEAGSSGVGAAAVSSSESWAVSRGICGETAGRALVARALRAGLGRGETLSCPEETTSCHTEGEGSEGDQSGRTGAETQLAGPPPGFFTFSKFAAGRLAMFPDEIFTFSESIASKGGNVTKV
ncbi:uncharacterized protein LOC129551931 [Moschus berezovskii]|uniref:uncharacterized protein LOC129551931 n=1 Tax=Moschus berezovskii TaxID=68408 RepID=UPI002443D2CC|nr:uncharacterized protein LOC129551931 [Moschus berezovskii]